MKRFVLFFCFILLLIQVRATDYYSQGSLDPASLSSWGTLMSGGSAPLSFTNSGDKFIVQSGHTMITNSAWIIGSATSVLQIQNGGVLQGDHLIQLTGTFQIDNGGKYIHNNNGSVSSTAGSSIWGGTESFAANSAIEIKNWINQSTPLPTGISWGNLVINLSNSIGGSWNQSGNLTSVQGDLQIISSGTSGQEFRITANTATNLTIGGNMIIDGGILNIKTVNTNACTVQVMGGIAVNNTGTLNAGVANAIPNTELRFKGNFIASSTATITSGDNLTYLVANGTTAQSLNCPATVNCSFRINTGATVNLSSPLITGAGKMFAVLGTFNDNGFVQAFGGPFEVASGTYNSSGSVTMGANSCRSCNGNGNYGAGTWCSGGGVKGRINFSGNSITFDQSPASALTAIGGDIYFSNAVAGFTTGSGGTGSVILQGGILSLDGNSYIGGNANYFGNAAATLQIGSVGGISATGDITNGNVRVSGLKAYNNTGDGVFEYIGTNPQITGLGLPTLLGSGSKTIKINNSAGSGTDGVTLSQTTRATVTLVNGKFTTSSSNLLVAGINAAYIDASFINGPVCFIGSGGNNRVPVGKGVTIHPIWVISNAGGTLIDSTIVEYFQGSPSCLPGTLTGGIHHVSGLEYWRIRYSGTGLKQIILYASGLSQATDRSRLVVSRCSAGTWENLGNPLSATGAIGDVYSAVNVTGPFDDLFTLASLDPVPVNPLPINLIVFDASKLSNTTSSINWELAACCAAAAKFEIQRAGEEKRFVTVGTIGGSETNKLYNYIDNGLKNGINYYRLKMTDVDGKISYSRIVAIMNGVNGLLLTSLIPTVVTNTATLTVASSDQKKLDIVIVDMQGRIVLKRNFTIAAGNTNFDLSLTGLAAGVYQLTGIAVEGKTNTIRFIKQ